MQSRETQLCRYHYDSLDQLIGHTPANKSQRRRYYCKSRLATEIQGAMRYSIIQHGDQLLAQQQSEGNAHDTTLLATDQQRSVVHTIKSDHTQQPFAYSPYGHRRPENGLLSLLGFNGERPDPVTGHYLLGNGYRAFNPVLMRFNSPDRLSPFGRGGFNAYAYCLGDPANRRDPNGTFAIPEFLVNPLNRLLKIFGGPDDMLKIERLDYNNGFWKEFTTIGTGENKVTMRTVSRYGEDWISVVDHNKIRTLKNNNPSLRELSYNKIPGQVLDNYYIPRRGLPPLDLRIDAINMNNARAPYRANDDLYGTLAQRMQKEKIPNDLAKQGLLEGVRPSLIRKHWMPIIWERPEVAPA